MKKPGTKKVLRAEDEENRKLILALVESATYYHKIGLPTESTNPLFKNLFDILAEHEFFPDELLDFNYFIKYLKRNGLIR